MSDVVVRPARDDDAALLATMANDLNDHVGIGGRPFTAERVLRDGLGPDRSVSAIVAEHGGAVVGYAFFALGYNTDVAGRSVWLHDLYVVPDARGRGVGRALMSAVAAETLRLGALSLEWGVHEANRGALDFYRRLGANDGNVRIMGLAGARLHEVAGPRS